MDYPHIVRTPGTCSGLSRIEGTRITVNLVVREVVRLSWTPEEVLIAHPYLTLAQIHAALAYYFDHADEVEASRREGDQLEKELRSQFPARLSDLVQPEPRS